MSPSEDNASGNPPESLEESPPITVLHDFEEDVSTEFVPRLRRRVHRRIFTGQVTQFSFNVPGMLLREFLQMIFGFLPSHSSKPSTPGSAPQKENRP